MCWDLLLVVFILINENFFLFVILRLCLSNFLLIFLFLYFFLIFNKKI